ncbi:histone-lysine N-methyltransferase 2A isoform X3 [Latimeria chalumnae]|uniref:Tetratricopeptide repeat protein 36 n=1 Tax=Latimeria chalumnae TaxID=7897 RepID=H3BFE3_LATCH
MLAGISVGWKKAFVFLHSTDLLSCIFFSLIMATANDRAVLQAIFNPNTPFGDIPGLDVEEVVTDDDSGFDAELLSQVKELEIQGVSAAETGDLKTALQRFQQAIRILPDRASGYNNRAQALRLRGDTAGAMEDLHRAIDLTRGKGQTACQAFVQRALIHRLEGRDEEAQEDFQKAACLGSEFARRQAVLMNPYAALCNRMLADVMQKLRNPDLQGS